MNKRLNPRYFLAVLAILALALIGACASGSSDESSSYPGAPGNPGADYDDVVPDSGYGTEEQYTKLQSSGNDSFESGSEGSSSSGGGASATAAPAATMAASGVVTVRGDSVSTESADPTTSGNSGSASVENEIASATDGRIIIRTADLKVTVDDVTMSMDDISNIVTSAGGWVVSSNQPRNYSGTISVRVPADRFDDVLEQFSDLAVKVKSYSMRSEDFTEEFTDVSARAQTLEDTLGTLRLLYDRAFSVEDAITIQKEITNIQSDLESLEARLTFLSQSSAFSFISVTLESVPVQMTIDAGEDIAAAMGHPVTFRATFTPPEGIEDFSITWNFGDGSRESTVNRVAPTGNGDEVITSPILHVFDRDEDSPFIVTAELTGSGDSGLAEGEDTLVTTVSRLPVIEVFAGENQTIESGTTVDFEASFTRPDGVTDIAYSWNFGDGSAPVEGDISEEEGGGQVNTSHKYENHRPNPYFVELTVTGQTDVGEVKATGAFLVFVRETIGVAAAELDAGDTTRDAVRTLQSVGVFFAKAGLWLVILSPAWLIGLAVIFVVIKRRKVIRLPLRSPKE
ncbi:MAG: DUF4349 domain-containing protein [Chloroflexi bacterium]|jgi:hypothetical protein|nr:DUF4349 domain-containing protein [Chloroflexota bacterium]MDA1283198.1 DUF4349 domain-containing protein [Chloroflexota bacterium]